MSSPGSDLLQRYADLITGWFEPGVRLARLSELLALRGADVAELRQQVAFEQHRANTYRGDLRFLELQHEHATSEREAWRERAEKAEAAIARVRHLAGTYRVNAESADDAKARNWFELFAEELQGALEPPHELLIEEETGRHVEP